MKKSYFEAFTVRQDEGDNYWTRIGVAFPLPNGGFKVDLAAMPPTKQGRYTVICLPPKPKADPEAEAYEREHADGDLT